MHYIHKLTEHDMAELLELAQDRDVWWEIVFEWSDLQPPDQQETDTVREFEWWVVKSSIRSVHVNLVLLQ